MVGDPCFITESKLIEPFLECLTKYFDCKSQSAVTL